MRTSFTALFATALAVLACPACLRSATPPEDARGAGAAAGTKIDFGAYHTQLQTGQDWERHSRTGQYADVVVNVGKAGGALVFWRGNSYLPYWKTRTGQWNLDEIIPRSGDGAEPMPDRNNVYSHVEVIENTPQHVIVHWRYLASFTAGNPHGNVNLANFVEETFTITPDGAVDRVIKQAAERIADWNDPANQLEQDLQLSEGGVREVGRTGAKHAVTPEKVAGNPVSNAHVVDPVLWFRFDEGVGAETVESVSRAVSPIAGPQALWKKGVSGTALEFDGYHSVVVLPTDKGPVRSGGSLTVEGWFALGAYPWDWAPIVQQGDNKGYFLGVDSHGYPGFMAEVGGKWQQLTVPSAPPYTDANHLALFTWYHVAGVYDQPQGTMRLYVNGREVARTPVGTGGLETVQAKVRIGKADILRKPTEGTHDTKPSEFGLDGLIDEVRIYDKALSAAQVSGSFDALNPGPAIVAAPDLQKRHLPTFASHGKFQAVYTHLPYYETWDNLWSAGRYADLVVEFDQTPMKLVFWRGASYIPLMVNESDQWYMNEFNETGFSKDARGDYEPMSDKPCLDSHVRLIESTPARVVVHWRYRLAMPDHHWAYYDDKTGWGDIADWYLYVYPDGVVCKRMRCYSSRPDAWHEWDEQIVIFGEGQHPESVIGKTPVMTLVDQAGNASDYDWNPEPPKPAYRGKIIQTIHLKGEYSPFTIQEFTGGDVYKGERTWYSVFPSWNHWPTSQIDSSGRNATFPDRVAHSSISHLFWPFSAQQSGDIGFQEKNLMEGMSNQPAASLTSLGRSWLHAPGVSDVSGGTSAGYRQSERAYGFTLDAAPLTFRIDASDASPIRNVCFSIKDWPSRTAQAHLKINGLARSAGPDFRQGVALDTDGTYTLIIWVGLTATTPQRFAVD